MIMTWNQIQTLKSDATPSTYGNQPHIMFKGMDVSDRYAIVRVFGTEGQDDRFDFYLFDEHDLSKPKLYMSYNNVAEAATAFAFRFILDNADKAHDCYNPAVQERHCHFQAGLRKLLQTP